FDQAQRSVVLRPGVQGRTRQPTPPGLVLEAQHPVRGVSAQADQAVARAFFHAYAGSGLVIQCLARFQPTPSRLSAWRMASPLTWRELIPWAKLTWAASSKVHRLVGWPNSRGLRCRSARNCSICSGPKTRRVRWGREEP